MIYVNGLDGRNVYTKLDNVLGVNMNKVNSQIQKEKDNFQKLGTIVNQNYKTFSENMGKRKYQPKIHSISIFLIYIEKEEKQDKGNQLKNVGQMTMYPSSTSMHKKHRPFISCKYNYFNYILNSNKKV